MDSPVKREVVPGKYSVPRQMMVYAGTHGSKSIAS